VRKRLPRVSLATVYRNLRTLAAEGLLVERAGLDGLRFDGNIERHDHFTCVASDEGLGKLSAVHFVRFPAPVPARPSLEASEVALVVDHPNVRARTVLSTETKASLAQDLA
jgi:Fur family ferric uptake transcriptional regulator